MATTSEARWNIFVQDSRRGTTELGDDLSRRETAELVARALGELPRAQREVVELKVYAELTFREIAEITGSPQGTVATCYCTALEQLRCELAELYP